jgi:simple sugar transport system ATP-binding protein
MIELRDIYKNFGPVKALRGVSLKVKAGSIHGVVGENGAGKSTLMKVLTGYIRRTSGTILVNGGKVELRTPRDAGRLGIGMLYQEPVDFSRLSVLENFMAAAAGFSPASMRTSLLELADRFGFDLDPDRPVEQLTLGERRQLELLRLIYHKTRVLILDEPTTGISEKQRRQLFRALEALRDENCSIILISHKLTEVDSLCDQVSILRKGKIVGHQKRPFDREKILTAMFDTLPDFQPSPQVSGGKHEILGFEAVSSGRGRSGLDQISVSFQEGEVVGLAGLDGSGQSVFLKLAARLLTPDSGTIRRFGSTDKTAEKQIVFLPADRLGEGLIAGMTIREHLLLAGDTPFLLHPATGKKTADQAIGAFNILGRPETDAEALSGGNQQRLLLALMPPRARLILMENPSHGLDVNSAARSWQHLFTRMPADGAIFFASPDLEEIMEYATRILVFFEGRIILDKPGKQTGFREISRAITGEAGEAA